MGEKFDREIDLKPKLNLIYDSKLKSNAKWQKIKIKTHNLTQSRAQNDPINCRMHGYSFRDFEDKDDIQDVISPYSLDQFSISSTPRTGKRVKKAKKSIDSWIAVTRQFDFTQKSKGVFSVAKNIEFIEEKRHNHRMRRFIVINGQDCASFDESMRLSRIHLIADGASRCCHVARRRGLLFRSIRWIFIGRSWSIGRSTNCD